MPNIHFHNESDSGIYITKNDKTSSTNHNQESDTAMTTVASNAAIRFAAPRVSLLSRLMGLDSLYRQRRALRNLDARALNDLGLSRAEAEAEAARPVWDAPTNWVK